MSTQHTQCSPVLMIGHGSSGTSILGTLLREHLNVAFGTESQFIIQYYQRLHRYGGLAEEANLRRLVGDLLKERYFRRSRKFNDYRTSVDAIVADVREPTYAGVLDAIFMQLAKHLNMPRWGDKTPEYSRHLPILGELFPDAKFIHAVRDGRDVAVSVMGRYWGPKNIYTAAQDWQEQVALIDQFAITLPANRIHEVRYEDLLSDPVATLHGLVEYLEIDDTNGSLMASIEQTVPGKLKRGNFDKWKRQWDEGQRRAYERIACVELRRHGYETIVDEPAGPLGALTKLFWYCDNKLRKWTYKDYWADNLYKAKTRVRDAWRALRSGASSSLRAES